MTSRGPRPSLSFPALMGGIGIISVLAIGAVVFAYFHFLRYERVALRHLPNDCAAVIHVDVEQGAVYEPVRQHWMGIIDSLEPADASRLSRIEERTRLNRRDLREIVLGIGANPSDWVLILGGLFPNHGVIERLGALFGEQKASFRLTGDRLALVDQKSGISIAQASDGALVFASSLDRVMKARSGGFQHSTLELSKGQVANFVVRGEALSAWARAQPDPIASAFEGADGVRQMTGTVRLGEPMTVDVAVFPISHRSVAETEAWVRGALGRLQGAVARDSTADEAGERAILDRMQLTTTKSSVSLSFTWEAHEVDRAAALAGEAVLATLNAAP